MNEYDAEPPDLTAVVVAIRETVATLLASDAHPEGHRATLTEPQIPSLAARPLLGFDVWELDGPPEDGGEPVRLLARLVTEDNIVCVFGFDPYNVCRTQAGFGNPGFRVDLIVAALMTEIDRGLEEE